MNDRYEREDLLARVAELENRLRLVEEALNSSHKTVRLESSVAKTDYTNMLGIATLGQINGVS
jgi:hypothetical protein